MVFFCCFDNQLCEKKCNFANKGKMYAQFNTDITRPSL